MDDPEQQRPASTSGRRIGIAVLVVVCLAVAGLLLTLVVPGDDPETTADPDDGAYETSCVKIPELRTIDDLQTIVDTIRGGPELQGGDVGADLELQDGRRIWLVGDTLRSEEFDGQRFVRNSMLLISPGCARTVLPEDNGAVIPDRADGVGYWPMSVGRVQRGDVDVVGVGVQRVRSTGGPNTTEFENLGPAIAVFHVERGGTPQLVEVKDLGPDDPSRTRPTWGAAVAVDDDWVYLYGTANPETEGVFGYSLRVARVRIDDIRDQRRWRYWDGSRWQRDPDSAQELIAAQGGVSQTLSVFEQDGSWYAVSKQDEFLGRNLVIWKAPSPTGPFTVASTAATIPSDAATGQLRYMPLAHPALLPEHGSVVVSYSRNNTDVGKVARNPFLYRPEFLRVDLP
ncbi:DUF4185 domain-containing protein [Mumia zhuanghuii]|uniref:DUF4185 domain-containing protein n=2 Tax=Mumia TaxID=1546255 RepID=A0ABW1QP29_9ACTN|nr:MULTISPECIES: DUF4185 domain-containing protein [Mumia]KAA1424894.1 DUF4185 domain-containing protein [Mumia zhuanghuii]